MTKFEVLTMGFVLIVVVSTLMQAAGLDLSSVVAWGFEGILDLFVNVLEQTARAART